MFLPRVTVHAKRPIKVQFRGQNVGDFEPDIVVNKTVLLEVKVLRAFAPERQLRETKDRDSPPSSVISTAATLSKAVFGV